MTILHNAPIDTPHQRNGSTRTITAVSPGVLHFRYSDFFSAFDRGPSPQPIKGIGKARCDCAVKSFELAAAAGVKTHFIERVDDVTFAAHEFSIPGQPLLSGTALGRFIALEWIWRGYLKGKLWERVENGTISPEALGFPEGISVYEGIKLPRLFLECSTKLEDVDRYLSDEEAMEIGELSTKQMDAARQVLMRGVDASNARFAQVGIDSLDGKGELGMLPSGEIIIVDTFGTQDENRLLIGKRLVSKDYTRNYLNGLRWKSELEAAKLKYPKDKPKWPLYPLLPKQVADTMLRRYQEVARLYAGA